MKPLKTILLVGAVILAAFFLRGFLKGLTSPSDPFETPDDFYYWLGF
jgi:hypothetical protein